MQLKIRCKNFSPKSGTVLLLLMCRSLTQDLDQISPNDVSVKGAFITLYGYASRGPNLGRQNCRSMLQCGHLCLKNPQCFSFNYKNLTIRNGFCELSEVRIGSQDEREKLIKMPGFVFVQTVRKDLPHSCLDFLRAGKRFSGVFNIFDKKGSSIPVYCDLTSEPGAAWTLIMSERTPGRGLFRTVPLFNDKPVSEFIPNWHAYRLSLYKMKQLRSHSSHWRITCNFQLDGLVNRDYVRGNLTDFDPIDYKGIGICGKVEYVNIRGHNCSNCRMAWWQKKSEILHHDSSSPKCGYDPSDGAVFTEDNFGYYSSFNPAFRCTESGRESTTNHWFGSYFV